MSDAAAVRKRRRPWWRWRLAALSLVPVGLVLQRLAAQAPEQAESTYARGVYPALADRVACLTGLVPFSVAEATLAGLLIVFGWRLYRVVCGRRGPRLPGLGWLALDIAALVGLGYFAFVLGWGLNYARSPFAESAGLDVAPAAVSELEAVTAMLVGEANALREGLGEDEAGRLHLKDGIGGALGRTAAGFEAVGSELAFVKLGCVRPRAALSSPLLARLGIAGIFLPWTAEAHVNVTLPAAQIPFSAAHEVAHRVGFAREDEANYLGYLACRRHPDQDFRYSGTLAASMYAQAALTTAAPENAGRVEATRSAGVRRDLDALREWAERYEGRAAEVSRRVNDAYLKSQGQPQGVASYGRMVDLLIAEHRARLP